MSRGDYEEWAVEEMDRLGMNEYEYCNYKGCNISDILKDKDDEDDEEANERFRRKFLESKDNKF